MAAIGKVGSYATVTPVDDKVGDALKYTNELFDRSEQRRKAEAEAKAKKALERQKEYETDLEKVKGVTTGKRGIDAVVYSAVDQLSKKLAQNSRDVEAGKLSKLEYDIQKKNMLNQIDLMNQSSKRINDQGQEYAKLIETDKIADGFEQDALNFGGAFENGDIYTEVDPNGNLQLISYKDDEAGNRQVIDKSDLKTFGNNAFVPVLKVDLNKDLELFKKNNPMGLQESISGTIKTGKKQVTPELDSAIKNHVGALINDPNRLSIAYKEATGDVEKNITDPEKIKKAQDFLYDKYRQSYQEEITKDEATSRANLDLERQKFKEAKEKDKPVVNIVETPPSYGEAGFRPSAGYKTVSIGGGKQVPVQQIKFFSNGKEEVIDTGYLNSYTVQKDGSGKRSIVAEITYPDFKSSTLSAEEQSSLAKLTAEAPTKEAADLILSRATKPIQYKTKIIPLTEKDAVKFKETVGAKDANDMKDRARVISADEEQNAKQEETKEERLARMKAELK